MILVNCVQNETSMDCHAYSEWRCGVRETQSPEMDSDPDLSQEIEGGEVEENERRKSYGYILLVKEKIESFISVIWTPEQVEAMA